MDKVYANAYEYAIAHKDDPYYKRVIFPRVGYTDHFYENDICKPWMTCVRNNCMNPGSYVRKKLLLCPSCYEELLLWKTKWCIPIGFPQTMINLIGEFLASTPGSIDDYIYESNKEVRDKLFDFLVDGDGCE